MLSTRSRWISIVSASLCLLAISSADALTQKRARPAKPAPDVKAEKVEGEDAAPEPKPNAPSTPADSAKAAPSTPADSAKADGDAKPKDAADPSAVPTDGEASKKAAKPKKTIETATFGGGCFWSFEAVFERLPGVTSVVSGFAGGSVPNPSYAMVCTGRTGHAEVIRVTFNPQIISYEKLLKFFWTAHDPTTPNAQGDDHGPQYRSMILYESEEQRVAAWKVYEELKKSRKYRTPIVTELVALKSFYPAEPYHQDYFFNNASSDYSQAYIIPKIWKLKLNKATRR